MEEKIIFVYTENLKNNETLKWIESRNGKDVIGVRFSTKEINDAPVLSNQAMVAGVNKMYICNVEENINPEEHIARKIVKIASKENAKNILFEFTDSAKISSSLKELNSSLNILDINDMGNYA